MKQLVGVAVAEARIFALHAIEFFAIHADFGEAFNIVVTGGAEQLLHLKRNHFDGMRVPNRKLQETGNHKDCQAKGGANKSLIHFLLESCVRIRNDKKPQVLQTTGVERFRSSAICMMATRAASQLKHLISST